eukprot:PhM_4_TR3117/c1_g1_i2/m.6559
MYLTSSSSPNTQQQPQQVINNTSGVGKEKDSLLSSPTGSQTSHIFSAAPDNDDDSDIDEIAQLMDEANKNTSNQRGDMIKLIKTIVALVSNIVGGGVLALSASFHDGSLLPSTVGLVFFGCVACTTLMMLVKLCDELKVYTYPQLWHRCFPSRGFTWLVAASIMLSCFGSCIFYIVIIRDIMGPLAQGWMGLTGFWGSGAAWVMLSAPLLFLLSSMRKITELSWTSVLAFLTIFYVTIVVFIRFAELPEEERPDIDILTAKPTLIKASSVFSIMFLCHYTAPQLYKELGPRRTPYKMSIAIAISFVIVIMFYFSTALVGYLTWGSDITKHGGDLLAHYPDTDNAMNVGRFFLLFHFIFVFPLQVLVGRRIFNVLVFGGERRMTRKGFYVQSFVVVSMACVLGIYVTGLGDVTALNGALFATHILMTFPAMMYWRVFLVMKKQTTTDSSSRSLMAVRVGLVGLIFLGISLCVASLSMTVEGMVEK